MERKSKQEDLYRRGLPSEKDKEVLAGVAKSRLLNLLHSGCAVERSVAASFLSAMEEDTVQALLEQLSVEKCLYTRIAIAQSLEKGTWLAAGKMTAYLGKIGVNQHKALPERVSKKKSFPLPRDLIARSLGKMNPSVFPVLLEVLKTEDFVKISEVLDAIGYMVFYHQELATPQNAEQVLRLQKCCQKNDVVLWKMTRCLAAFPCKESEALFMKLLHIPSVIGREAGKSLDLWKQKIHKYR